MDRCQALSDTEGTYLIHFTPRRARSIWSQINRERASVLIKEGRVQPQGLAHIDAAKSDGRWANAYAPASTVKIPDDFQSALDLHPDAALRFGMLKSAARYEVLHALETAKRRETRERRIKAFVTNAAEANMTD